MSRRLPTFGQRSVGSPGQPLASEERSAGPTRLLVVGGAIRTAPSLGFATLLAHAIAERRLPVGLVTVSQSQREMSVGAFQGEAAPELQASGVAPTLSVDGPMSALTQGLDALWSRFTPPRWIVAHGTLVLGLCRPALGVLLTSGVGLVGWSEEARAVRSDADLILIDARPAVASHLADRIVALERAAGSSLASSGEGPIGRQ